MSPGSNICNWKIKTAIYVVDSFDVTVQSIDMQESCGVGMVFLNTGGNVSITNSTFSDNRVCSDIPNPNTDYEYPGGGGLHIELVPCGSKACRKPPMTNTHYEIVHCHFDGNTASAPLGFKTAYPSNGATQYYGRGGGLFIGLAGDTHSNLFLIRHCKMKENSAVWGGAIALYVIDHVHDSSITIYNCTLEENSSPQYGGGGAVIRYETAHTDMSLLNSITFMRCDFLRNKAIFGGGLEFVGGSVVHNDSSLIHFLDCTFTGNQANSSAALDITAIRQSVFLTGLKIHFTNCTFTENQVVDNLTPIQNNTATQVKSGTGTFTVLYFEVRFLDRVVFENNTGTALYVVAGSINFEENIEANFLGNSGYNGGAIALVASSVMIVSKNSSFIFSNNIATRSGAAIFSLNLGIHQLHKVVVTMCFIGCADSGCNGSVNFYFSGNKAGVSNTNGIIFSDNLPACSAYCNQIMHQNLDVKRIFSCIGSLHFCEYYQDSECFNCSASAHGKVRGLADRFVTGGKTPLLVFPGQSFDLLLNVSDEVGNSLMNNYYVASVDDSSAFVEPESLYVVNNSVRIGGISPVNTTLTLRRQGFYDFQLRINISVLECPPGYALNQKQHCSCKDEFDSEYYTGVLCMVYGARIVHGKWIGYISDNQSPKNLHTSLCPIGFCAYNIVNSSEFSSSYLLPTNSSELERFVCAPTREGRACGKCVDGFSVYYHSPQFTCSTTNNSCRYGWFLYIVSELVPITVVYFILVVILNVSFTSGLVNGFIFYAQVVDTLVINANGINGLIPSETWIRVLIETFSFTYNSFNLEFFSLEQLSFCLWSGAGILDVLVMKYATIVYAFILVLGTVFVLNRVTLTCKCTHRSRLRKLEGRNHIIHGLTAFIILCYVQCMRVSFLILTPTHLEGFKSNYSRYHMVYYSGHLDYMKGKHLFYALPALACVLVFLIPIPVTLLVYPLFLKVFSVCGYAESKTVKYLSVPFEKAKPLLDSFQSSYKDSCRFVAGLFFVYRALILLLYAVSIGYGQFYVAIGVQMIVMIILHFVMQPHQIHLHNILDVLVFANLAAINSLSLYKFGISYQHDSASAFYVKVASIMQLILIFTPLVVVQSWPVIKLVLALKRKVKPKPRSLMSGSLSDIDYSSYDHRPIRLASFN